MPRYTLKQRFQHWWSLGRIPRFFFPYVLRRKIFCMRQLRECDRSLDRLHNSMQRELAGHENDPDGGMSIVEWYERGPMQHLLRRKAALENQSLKDDAFALAIEVDEPALWDYSDPTFPHGIPNERQRIKLKKDIYEEKWRRRQRFASTIVPPLSLLVALTALLTTRACK